MEAPVSFAASFRHPPEVEKIAQAFGDGYTWALIAIAFVAGMLGGLAHKLAAVKRTRRLCFPILFSVGSPLWRPSS